MDKEWGTWVAQLVKRLTLSFGSGHNPRVLDPRSLHWAPCSTQSASQSLFLSLCPSCSYSLK